jgi:phosphonate transport system substrate-binding protein
MEQQQPLVPRIVTRRAILGGVAGVAVAAFLAACGADATPTARPATIGTTTTGGVGAAGGAAPTIAGTAVSAPTAAATTAPTAVPAVTPAGASPTAVSATASRAASATAGSPVAVPTGVTGLAEATAAPQVAGSVQPPPDFKGKLSLKKINVAFIPAEDAGKTLSDNKDLIAYMKQSFGVDVSGAVGTSYTAVIEAMRSKKVDIGFYGPFSYILAHAEANAQALIQGQDKDGKLAVYNSYILVPADSPITMLADLRGKSFSFVDPASTSGHLVPSYTILQKGGLKETDYKPIYAGSHPASYQAVANKKVDAGAIASDIYATGVAAGTIDASKVKIIDTSFAIPGSPIAIRGDIPQADQDLFAQLFLSINDQPKDSTLFKATTAGLGSGTVKMLKADDSTYDELRKIPAAIGIDIKNLK